MVMEDTGTADMGDMGTENLRKRQPSSYAIRKFSDLFIWFFRTICVII